jgi:hypothetical protein
LALASIEEGEAGLVKAQACAAIVFMPVLFGLPTWSTCFQCDCTETSELYLLDPALPQLENSYSGGTGKICRYRFSSKKKRERGDHLLVPWFTSWHLGHRARKGTDHPPKPSAFGLVVSQRLHYGLHPLCACGENASIKSHQVRQERRKGIRVLNHLAFAVAMMFILSAPQLVLADPITYDFTGTLSQPADGVKTFSGSLTLDATPTGTDASPGGAYVNETKSDVWLSVTLGAQVFNFPNSSSSSDVGVFLERLPGPYDESAQPSVLFSEWASSDQLGFWMKFISHATSIPTDLATLSLPLSTSSVDIVTNNTAQGYEQSQGVITSIELRPVPEPGTLAIFAGLGVAALLRRRAWHAPADVSPRG